MPQSLPLSTFIGAFDEAPTPTHNSSVHELSPNSSSSSTSSQNHHHQYPHLEEHGSVSSPLNEDDAERLRRLAAEEDKRRRNTAASARFRVKKKQRDQELERRAREQAEKVSDLEVRKSCFTSTIWDMSHGMQIMGIKKRLLRSGWRLAARLTCRPDARNAII